MRGSGQGGGCLLPAVIGSVLFLISFVSWPMPQAAAVTAAEPQPASASLVRSVPQTAAWFLELVRHLLHAGRNGESYQLAQLAVARFPQSPDLRLGAAYAAIASGRCRLADRHLAVLRDRKLAGSLTRDHRRQHDMLRAQCHGPWQRIPAIEITAGYRPSLSDRAQQFEIRLEPGSRLHGLCSRLRGLCDPDRRFSRSAARDSGIDMWTQFRLAHRYRAGTAWDADITPLIFHRQPSRGGHQGQGAILRAEARRHLQAGRQLHLLGETGVASFRQGDPALAFSQSHRRVRAAYAMPHTARLSSHFGHGRTWVRSRWLDLRQRRHDYRLHIQPHALLSLWAGVAAERASQSGSGRLAGSRSRIRLVGAQHRFPLATLTLWQEIRHRRFTAPLSYLAAPHRATTRLTGFDLAPNLPNRSNLKVVVSFSYRRISSPDVAKPKSTKTLMFTFRYTFRNTP